MWCVLALIQVAIATSVTLMAGLFQLLMYVCRLGVIATYMSKPFIGGFMTGAAAQIITAQVRQIQCSFLPLDEVNACISSGNCVITSGLRGRMANRNEHELAA